MLVGLQGSGKTTSAGKLANLLKNKLSKKPLLAGLDVYRPAAIEQLGTVAKQVGVDFFNMGTDVDPVEVAKKAVKKATDENYDVLILDTAGRLHNKENLVRELEKIDRICAQKAGEGCYKKLLVLDATTGQNALCQAEVFNEAVGVDAIVLTKYDSSAKGGIAITIGKEMNVPVAFVCTGEGYDDIALFEPEKYLNEFLGL